MSMEHDAPEDAYEKVPLIDLKRTPPMALASPALALIGAVLLAASAVVGLGVVSSETPLVASFSLAGGGLALAWAGAATYHMSRKHASLALQLEGFIEEVAQALDALDARLDRAGSRETDAVRDTLTRTLEVRVAPKTTRVERVK